MNNTKSLLLLLLMAVAFGGNAQVESQLLSLDNYRIPLNKKGAKIGRFITTHPEKISIKKDPAKLFALDAKGNLSLRKDKSLLAGAPFVYELVVTYGDQEKSFDLVKDEFLHNKVVAHRGAWKHNDVHQNSVGALKNAIRLGCEASEFDVWLSKDKRVALNHDHEINNLIIEETDLPEMQKIILESGEVMATLEQYLDCIKSQNKTRLVLELKSNTSNNRVLELTDSVMNIVHRMKAQAWVDYISFDYRSLLRVKALDAGAPALYLGADRPMDLQKVEGMTGIDYHISQFDKIERLYDRARALGLTINIWTVNDEQSMNRLLDIGVDLITTDEPELLFSLIEKRKK